MKQAYLAIINTLRGCGYKAKGEVLNAMYFNVPQSRQRVIIIGVRENLGIESSHPKPKTKVQTVKDAIWELRNDPTDLLFNVNTRTASVMLYVKPGGHDPRHHGRVKENWNRPARTLCHDFLGYFHVWHPDADRPLTLLEWKRLASYPDDFKFTDKKNGCARIGNSVPPNLMRAIAEHIKKNILRAK
jgi:DNA (cytosine-5)-methyltransferase 1